MESAENENGAVCIAAQDHGLDRPAANGRADSCLHTNDGYEGTFRVPESRARSREVREVDRRVGAGVAAACALASLGDS